MQEIYYELSFETSSYKEVFLDLVSEIYFDAIEEIEKGFILRSSEDLSEIKWGLEEFTKALSAKFNTTIDVSLNLKECKNIDWIKSYQDSVNPTQVGCFYIRPSWHNPQNNLIDIIINPSLAFGSGHHETTSSCLELISKYVKPKDIVLDVGCGSGILAIASNKLGAIVDICDSDELAISNSIDNFKINNSEFRTSKISSASEFKELYDVVIANIVADVLIFISKDLKAKVKNGAILILSGILEQYLDRVLEKFKEFEIIDKIQKAEWVTIALKLK